MSSSIFETGLPKFVGTGDPNTNGVTLYYSVLDPNFSEKVFTMFEAPLTGVRTWKYKGRHATFDVFVNLHKFDSKPKTTPYNTAESVASLLMAYDNKNVNFYPFYNAMNEKGLKDEATGLTLITCHIVDIKFDFLRKTSLKYDVCTITFKTNAFHSLSALFK